MDGVVIVIPDGVQSSLYVDDAEVYCTVSTLEGTCHLLQMAMDNMKVLATSNGYRFPTPKQADHFIDSKVR